MGGLYITTLPSAWLEITQHSPRLYHSSPPTTFIYTPNLTLQISNPVSLIVSLSGYTRLFYPTSLQTCLSSSLKYFLPLPLTHIHSSSVSSIALPAKLKLSGSPPAQSLENADLQYSTFCHGMQHREMLFYTRVGEWQQQCNLVYYWAAYEESTTPTFQQPSTRTASISRWEHVWGK